jgi:glycosyltransferase involved in cell wall biosynthesis
MNYQTSQSSSCPATPPDSTTGISVSVVIPAYNMAPWLPETLDSILAQTRQPLEILVIDDGSTDNTAEVLAPYLTDDKVKHIQKPRGGLQNTRNYGMKIASGETVMLVDADDLLAENALSSLASKLEELGEDYCLVHGNMECFDDETRESLGIRLYSEVTKSRRRIFSDRRNLLLASLVRRDALLKVGGFDETAKQHKELLGKGNEMQLVMKLAKTGKKFASIDSVVYQYRIRAGSGARTRTKTKTIAETEVRKNDLIKLLKGESLWVKMSAWGSQYLFAGVDIRNYDIRQSRKYLMLSFLCWPFNPDPLRLLIANLRGRWPERSGG